MAQNKQSTLTRKLSRDIDDAYEAYKAKAQDAEKRLLGAFLAQARNIARFRLGEMYDGTVAYDAAHKAMLGLKNFHGKSALSTWFFQIVKNESFSELSRLLKKREREESINVRVPGGEQGEKFEMEIPDYSSARVAGMDEANLRSQLPPEQSEILKLNQDGYTVSQIAEMKGLKRGTVASRLRLAKAKINWNKKNRQ